MDILPAIDLKDGKAVRLTKGLLTSSLFKIPKKESLNIGISKVF